MKRNITVWFVVGFLVLGTVVAVVAGVMSGGKTSGGGVNTNGIPAAAVSAGDWKEGSANAKVTLIEYGDFQCPACGSYYPLVKKLTAEYSDRVQFVFREFPLYTVHPNGGISAQAAEAAGLQGKFWEMYDQLYSHQNEWATIATNQVVAQAFDGYARSIGLDVDRFNKDITSDQVLKKIQADVDGANAAGVNATPTFYVNLKQIANPRSYDEFKSILDAALAQ